MLYHLFHHVLLVKSGIFSWFDPYLSLKQHVAFIVASFFPQLDFQEIIAGESCQVTQLVKEFTGHFW
jgi:ABC-type Zn uptake system ZnuABC Zn-binding protein ZnuA